MHGCRVLGPNSLGFLRPVSNLNASLYPELPLPGNIAFISESGIFSAVFLEHAIKKKVGFSYFVSLGAKLDVNFADLIDFLGRDGSTTAIFLHVQSIHNGRRFMTALRNFARSKPIVVVKTGKSEASIPLSITDCGCLAAEDLIYEAVFKRAGSLRVNNIVDLLDMVETVAKQVRPKGQRLLVITNSIAPSEMAIDALEEMGGLLANPDCNTLSTIGDLLSIKRELHNPLYLLADAPAEAYQVAISACLRDPAVDGILVICLPFPGIDFQKIAEAIVAAAGSNPKVPLFATWCGEETGLSAIAFLNSKNIPTFYTPEQAVKSFMYLYHYDYNLKLLQETPEILLKDFSPDLAKAEKIIRGCLDQQRFALHAEEARDILNAYGIPVLESVTIDTADEACRVSRRIGYPVVIKVYSPNTGCQQQTGRVLDNLKNGREVRAAFAVCHDHATSLKDSAARVIVQPMTVPNSYALAVGAKKSRSFGTVILFGLGGEYLHAEKDYSIGLPPLNQTLARRMMEETKIYRYLLAIPSFHDALGYLEELLVRFSQLLIDLPQIDEIDMNPLLLTEHDGVVRDVLIHLDKKLPKAYHWAKGDLCPLHLSIPPYPFKYEKEVVLKDGTAMHIRPIRGEDEPAMRSFFESLNEESVFFRFGMRRINMPHVYLARFCQVDYDRDLAFLAVDRKQEEVIVGDVRLNRFADPESAELSFAVADSWQGRGIGSMLMEYCIAVAGDIGIKSLWMEINKDNWRMIKFGQKYRFNRLAGDEGDDMVEMVLDLTQPNDLAAPEK
jgi:acetyltransferase